MKITVRDLLNIKEYRNAIVIAGEKGLDREVHHINVMETPDIADWLSTAELLLTTGYTMRDNPTESMLEIVQTIYDKNCAGLAIKTKFTGPVDESVVELANKLEVPLILLPNDIPFIELFTPIIQTLTDQQIQLRKYYQNIHDIFIELELNGGSFQGISDMILKLVGLPSIILDEAFNLLTSANENINLDFEIVKKKIKSQNADIIHYIDFENSDYIIRKVHLKSTIIGYILIKLDWSDEDNEMINIVLDHASTAIMLEISKQRAINEYHADLDNMFFIDITSGNIKSVEELDMRANALNWPQLPYLPIHFDIKDFVNFSKSYDEYELHNIKLNVLRIIRANLLKKYKNVKVFLKSDSFSCLCANEVDVQIDLDYIMADIIYTVSSEYNFKIYAGIGNIIYNFCEIETEFKNAESAMQIAMLTECSEQFSHIDHVHFEYGILKDESTDFFMKYAKSKLSPLVQYDIENNTELLKTFYYYLVECCNISNTASRLFIHRNTMNYRLTQIRELLQSDLKDGLTMMDYSTAFKINSILKIYRI